jgi:hypothetical protein
MWITDLKTYYLLGGNKLSISYTHLKSKLYVLDLTFMCHFIGPRNFIFLNPQERHFRYYTFKFCRLQVSCITYGSVTPFVVSIWQIWNLFELQMHMDFQYLLTPNRKMKSLWWHAYMHAQIYYFQARMSIWPELEEIMAQRYFSLFSIFLL